MVRKVPRDKRPMPVSSETNFKDTPDTCQENLENKLAQLPIALESQKENKSLWNG